MTVNIEHDEAWLAGMATGGVTIPNCDMCGSPVYSHDGKVAYYENGTLVVLHEKCWNARQRRERAAYRWRNGR